ncbi:MAG: DJ-1/PfpI family protein [Deltaproteobacteria bacterium]|nr:DJ-1/PfpI family protein [Deltaproteobacteria bacterium]
MSLCLCGVSLLATRPAPAVEKRRVVILANNSGTETTDLLTPFAVLRDADVADVRIVAPASAPVTLMPGLTILPDATLGETPPPDVAIVPAMHDPRDPRLLDAVRRWAAAGVLLVSICDGAWVLAHAGVLEGRTATSHWYSIGTLRAQFPHTTWRQDRRWVRDGTIVTSAGVSASLPLADYLVEVLAGRAALSDDAPAHDGAAFAIRAADIGAGALNYALPWRHDVVAVPLRDGIDELALGVGVDLLARTYAVQTITTANRMVRGRRGLRILPDAAAAPAADRSVEFASAGFDAGLADIEQRYGAATRSLVALQLEYPPGRWPGER